MLSKPKRIWFLAAILATAVVQANADNIVVDPGFESATSNTYTGSAGDGWVVTAGTVAICNDLTIAGVCGNAGAANTGNQMAFLDWGNNTVNTISQTLTTVGGQTYTISFFVAGSTTYSNSLTVEFGGTTLLDGPFLPTTGGYVQYTFTSTANSPSTVLAFSGDRTAGGGEILLDDVSVTASSVPEPSSLMLLGTGALGFFGPIRRRLLPHSGDTEEGA